MDITPYLELAVEKEASDIFFSANTTPKIKIEGKVSNIGKQPLTGNQVRDAAFLIMDDRKKSSFLENLESDFATSVKDGTRFRVNVFYQRGNVAMVVRRIPSIIPSLDDLKLPDVLKNIVSNKRGLVLMVGATGSGKSTTLAAMLRYRNENHSGHILTIEDPIEFVHQHEKCLVSQREIGVDTLSYEKALRSSLREAPDVILIGEIRSRETMEAAIELSNTGHLAVSTIHANNTNQTLERIINMFPVSQHKELYMDLSLNLVAIISQRLVMGSDNRRRAAIEIMMCTPYIRDLILKGDLSAIKQAMEESGQEGMQTFDQALYQLEQKGDITREEALSNADSTANLEAKFNFG